MHSVLFGVGKLNRQGFEPLNILIMEESSSPKVTRKPGEKKRGKKQKTPVVEEEENEGGDTMNESRLASINDVYCGVLEAVLREIQRFDPPLPCAVILL